MKRIKLTEQERKNILSLHSSLIINEDDVKVQNYKIEDIQKLLNQSGANLTTDNILGPKTLEALKQQIEKKQQSIKDTVEKPKVDTEKQKGEETIQQKQNEIKSLLSKLTGYTPEQQKGYLADLGYTQNDLMLAGVVSKPEEKSTAKVVSNNTMEL